MATRSNKVYVGDVGTVLLLNTGTDLTDAVNMCIKVKKPDGIEYEFGPAEIYNTKYIKYVTRSQNPAYATIAMAISNTSEASGLEDQTTYDFVINDVVYEITTGISPTYLDVITLMQAELDFATVTIDANQDLIFTHNELEEDIVVSAGTTNDIFSALNTYIGIMSPTKADFGDFDQDGTYYLQAYVELNSWKGRGETAMLEVYKRFK